MSFVDIPDNAVFRCIEVLCVEQENKTITFEKGDVIVLRKTEQEIQFAMFRDIHDIFQEGIDEYYSHSHEPFERLLDTHSEHPTVSFNEFVRHFQFDAALDRELTDWISAANSIIADRSVVYNKNLNYTEGFAGTLVVLTFAIIIMALAFPAKYVLPSAFIVYLWHIAHRITIAFENKAASRKAEEAWEELETCRLKISDQYNW